MSNKSNEINIVFYGTDEWVSIPVLEELVSKDLTPKIVVTVPDRPQGRKLVLTPSPVKVWAQKQNIKVMQPEKLDDDFISELKSQVAVDLQIVASYGKILPKSILEIPKHGTLNVHPSLLPKYRGATPIESAILDDQKETGVTIIEMDAEMDHGPIVGQEMYKFLEWPSKEMISRTLAHLGGQILAEIIPNWVKGNVDKKEQEHKSATFTKKVEKMDGLLNKEDSERVQFLKYIAHNPWPGTFFFIDKDDKQVRVKITDAIFDNGLFVIKKVIPEGKKEMSFDDFERGYLG